MKWNLWGEVGCDLPDIYFTAANENVLALWNLESDTGCFFSSCSFHVFAAGDLKENKGTRLCIQRCCLAAADDIVLLGELEFGPTTWAGRRQMFVGSSQFPCSVCLRFWDTKKSHVCHRNPKVLAFDAVRGERAFIWNAVWQVCLKKQIMCCREDIQAVLSLCSGPDGKLPGKLKKSLWNI